MVGHLSAGQGCLLFSANYKEGQIRNPEKRVLDGAF